MTTHRKSENQNPNGPHDLGQIDDEPWEIKIGCKCPKCGCNPNSYTGLDYDLNHFNFCPECGEKDIGKKTTQDNPKPWVIIENAGTDNENIVIDFATFREACNYIDRNYTDDDCPADIMRRRNDGVLTTEY
ncbi:MAG: hypothetical protein H6R15_198 [Proteobacteria bacterium]|nr:hypothetical protein [Pseudomonadota bacterium]